MTNYFYDVFIAHAYEDQDDFAGRLAFALKKKGLKVWYSGFEFKRGTLIGAMVSDALKKSRMCVIIISPVYLTSRSALKQIKELKANKPYARRIVSIAHGISKESVQTKMSFLTDKYLLSSRRGYNFVAGKIAEIAGGSLTKRSVSKTMKSRSGKRGSSSGSAQNAGVIVLGGKAENTNKKQGQ